VAVVGCSGSGKTTLARSLAVTLGAPHVELDAVYHQPGWTPLEDDEFRAQVRAATEADAWVVDGNYSTVQDIVWDRADTVVWCDFSFPLVMARTVRRTLWRTLTREELWNGNREPLSNLYSLDPERNIIVWSATRHRVYRRRYGEAARRPPRAGLRFVRLRSPREADGFVHGVAAALQTTKSEDEEADDPSADETKEA